MTETGLPEPPAPVSLWRRVWGWLVDCAIIVVPACALVLYAATSVYQGGLLASALIAVPLLQFAYHAVSLSWRGRTFGKMVSGTRVDTGGSRGAALRRAVTTTFLETGVLSLACAAFVAGRFRIAAVILAFAVVAFWLNALLALGPSRRSLADRMAATVVTRHSPWHEFALGESTVRPGSPRGRRNTRAAPALGHEGVLRGATVGRKNAAASAAGAASGKPSGAAWTGSEGSAATVEFGDGYTDGRYLTPAATQPSAAGTNGAAVPAAPGAPTSAAGPAGPAEPAGTAEPSGITGATGATGATGPGTSELAAAAGRRAREGAESLATGPPGQRAQALGAAGTAHARGRGGPATTATTVNHQG